jgi:hypothetical protein
MLGLVKLRPGWLAASAVTLAAVSAFLAWGPIGLGNGPLWMPTASGGTYGWSEQRTVSVAFVLPIGNHGQSAAVIDNVEVMYRQGFKPSVLLKALTGRMTSYGCTALGAVSGPRSALAGCVQSDLRVVTGATIPAGAYLPSGRSRKHEPALVLELAGPAHKQCWDITSIVVHYHVGIRHYAGTFPQANVITCGVDSKVPDLN